MGILMFGEVVWDDITEKGGSGKPEHLGGAPLNVAVHSARLGVPSAVCSSLGRDPLGDQTVEALQGLPVDAQLVTRNRWETCLIKVQFGEDGEPVYHIPEDVSWDHITVPDSGWERVNEYSCLYYGSLALRNNESRNTAKRLLERGSFSHVFCDVNLRPPFYTVETLDFCLQNCDIAKLNEQELLIISQVFSVQGNSLEEAMRGMMAHFHLERLVVTLGSSGCAYLDGPDFGLVPGLQVCVKDPVGAGDGFCAGLLAGLEQGTSLKEACVFGNQLGAFIATQVSSIPVYTKTEFDEWRGRYV